MKMSDTDQDYFPLKSNLSSTNTSSCKAITPPNLVREPIYTKCLVENFVYWSYREYTSSWANDSCFEVEAVGKIIQQFPTKCEIV